MEQTRNSDTGAPGGEEALIVNVIHGQVCNETATKLHRELDRATSVMQVLSVGKAPKQNLATKEAPCWQLPNGVSCLVGWWRFFPLTLPSGDSLEATTE